MSSEIPAPILRHKCKIRRFKILPALPYLTRQYSQLAILECNKKVTFESSSPEEQEKYGNYTKESNNSQHIGTFLFRKENNK